MILVLDNYDSFTWNLVHYLRELGAEVRVARNDELSVDEALHGADAVLISPGPGTPDAAGISLELVGACAEARRPLLGVCLGHQAIGQHFGGKVARAPEPVHGKPVEVTHDGRSIFKGLPGKFNAGRYHSLIVERAGMPDCLEISAESPDGLVMALRHRELPIEGVQFHPESILTEHGKQMLANFLKLETEN